ncbi:hypothetical protein JCM8547_006014 [Rhodosporidiobolus lusitaniae]
MLASLAGGASCGPSNPLQQLSKTYGQDRGVAQDHFSQPGPSGSQTSFRQHPAGSSAALPNDPSAQQFFQPHAAPSPQPFNLTPLNRALSPAGQSASPAPPPPAWATAFQQQQRQHPAANSLQEQELFAQAFGGKPAEQHQWRSEFQARPGQQHQQAAPSPVVQHAPPVHAQTSRLYGQGFASVMPIMQMGMAGRATFSPSVEAQQGRVEGDVQQGRQDWEKAFLAQDAASSPAEIATATFFDGVTETRPLTPPLRAHTPVADPVARDVLAQTAANLLSTVHASEEQRQRDVQPAEQVNIGNKFANSSFMALMRQLRDGEVAVEGDKVVEQVQPFSHASKGKARADGWASDFAATLREEEGRVGQSLSGAPPVLRPGDGIEQFAKAQHAWADRQAHSAKVVRDLQDGYAMLEGMWDDEDRARAAREREKGKGKERAREGVQFQGDGGAMVDSDEEVADTHVPLAQSSWEEDLDDPAFISGGHAPGLAARQTAGSGPTAQQQEWDLLQRDWDDFEVTATGLQPKNRSAEASTSSTSHGYAFAQNNPFLQRHQPTSHHHSFHNHGALSAALYDRHESLLQHEANVQHDPTNASAWLELGLKQQQNEREDLAIAALRRAIELDPTVSNGGAHLGLAVSYTNEGRRFEAYEEIDRWVSALGSSTDNRVYANEIDQYRNLLGAQLPRNTKERHEYLSGLLIRLAQSGAESVGVDSDVQVALGVLFNSSEEYDKAGDCFEAALSVRPDDPLLFNRLGATYANSGKTDLAIQYYNAALDLDPGYVRARFNLAVANMNLGRYEESVGHLLTSLEIQETEVEQDYLEQAPVTPSRGITSNTLWDSLSVSLLQMHRSDLTTFASQRDLQGLKQAFASMA